MNVAVGFSPRLNDGIEKRHGVTLEGQPMETTDKCAQLSLNTQHPLSFL
jgi:hypothetical protein